MKIAERKRYICPASELFEMEGDGVLLAGSDVFVGPGNAGDGPSGEGGGSGQPINNEDLDPDPDGDNLIWP